MAENIEVKERSKFSKICSILVDILIIPILILAFACSIMMFSAKSNNKVPSLFGNSLVEVLSNSMYPEFKKGDMLTINAVNLDSLVVGDAIAFYAPEQSGYKYGDGKPMVIYHQIIRIIHAKDDNGVYVRYFVCKGTNVTPETEYVFIEGGKGDYRKTEEGKYISKKEDGNYSSMYTYNYVAKLLDDDVKADGDYDIDVVENQNMSVYQYVTDENVVGVYKGRVSGFLAGIVNLCTSPTGILLLVIVPSGIMIGLVIAGMIKESKDAKNEAERDRKALNKVLNFGDEEDNKSQDDKLKTKEDKKIEENKVDTKQTTKVMEDSQETKEIKEEKAASVPPQKIDSKQEANDDKEVKNQAIKSEPKVPKKTPAKVETVKEVAATQEKDKSDTKVMPDAPKKAPAKVVPQKAKPAKSVEKEEPEKASKSASGVKKAPAMPTAPKAKPTEVKKEETSKPTPAVKKPVAKPEVKSEISNVKVPPKKIPPKKN